VRSKMPSAVPPGESFPPSSIDAMRGWVEHAAGDRTAV
jgi:hypothetical protein